MEPCCHGKGEAAILLEDLEGLVPAVADVVPLEGELRRHRDLSKT